MHDDGDGRFDSSRRPVLAGRRSIYRIVLGGVGLVGGVYVLGLLLVEMIHHAH